MSHTDLFICTKYSLGVNNNYGLMSMPEEKMAKYNNVNDETKVFFFLGILLD